MKLFGAYNLNTGQFIWSLTVKDTSELAPFAGIGYIELGSQEDSLTGFVQNGEIVQFPDKPSPHHEWDWPTKSWLPDLDAARNARLQEVSSELNRRLYLPCNGFDADNVSRDRISGTIARLQRGDGLPAGWMGWRDADNQQHWAEDDAATVLANLCTLSRAIEDREQALLVAGWTHKANIAVLEDIDAILSYDVTKNWPT